MSERTPLILDVDTGIDDAMALAFALASPAAEVVAVTTVAGNVEVEATTANTLAVLDHLGATKIPVHRGASHPLVRPHRDASYVHDASGLGSARIAPSMRAAGANRGPAAIIRLAAARPGELTLVCLGPLTNLAIALNVEPALTTLLKSVVVMGGAFEVPGNTPPQAPIAEYNIFADPEAAAQVFAAPFPDLAAVGLDVTQQVPLPKAAWEAASAVADPSPATTLVVEVCRQAFTERGLSGYFLHDPLAVAVALDPTLVRGLEADVAVAVGEAERGRTRISGPGAISIATTVDTERFMAEFSRMVGGTAG